MLDEGILKASVRGHHLVQFVKKKNFLVANFHLLNVLI